MKKIILFFLVCCVILSCSKEEAPIIDVKIEMNESSRFKIARLFVSEFSLFEIDENSGATGVSIIQQWDGIEIEQNLSKLETNSVLRESHWEMVLTGIKPRLAIALIEDDSVPLVENENVFIVETDYVEYIEIERSVLQNEKEYEIIIIIDSDNALEEIDGTFTLNWEFVIAKISEK